MAISVKMYLHTKATNLLIIQEIYNTALSSRYKWAYRLLCTFVYNSAGFVSFDLDKWDFIFHKTWCNYSILSIINDNLT